MRINPSRLLAIALVGISCLPSAAFAQVVVSDPATELATQNSFLQSIKSFTQDGQILNANNTQILKQIQTINNQVTQIQAAKSTLQYEQQQLSSVMQNQGNPLVNLIKQNNTLMMSQSQLDPKLTAEFAQMVPNYKPGTNYATYAQTLNQNTAESEAQALGVGSSAVTSEAQVNTALTNLTNSPTNQLQALQEIVQIGKIQSGQLDKLVKIQAAMMKNMAYEWAAHEKIAQGSGNSQLATTGDAASARQICSTKIQGFNMMSAGVQAQYMTACMQAASQQSTVGSNTTP
jgi:hypothetical protein